MSALERLNKELSYPGQQALLKAAKKKGIAATRADVQALVSKNAAKQEISAIQPSKGHVTAETLDSRWQADLAELHPRDSGLKKLRYVLIVVNVFDRKVYTRSIREKTPEPVLKAMRSIVAEAGEKPYSISTDEGPEFTNNQMKAYLDSIGVALRLKSKGDANSVGVVDKAIQTMKKKLKVTRDTEGGNWESLLARVTKAMNSQPKEVLHGEAPEDVKDNEEVRFMLNQDNARKISDNDKMRQIKAKALEGHGGNFRAPLKIDKAWTKRGFRATYGPVIKASDVKAGIVFGADGKGYNLKQIKPVRV